jgi:dienelactone hydrolase
MIKKLLLCLFALATFARADETVIRTFETSAAPLQCYRALCEDWIYMQWADVKAAAFGGAPESPWRVTLNNGGIEEGILKILEPGVTLEYTFVGQLEVENVHFDFIPTDTGTTVKLTHTIPGDAEVTSHSALIAGEKWDNRIRSLKPYLDMRPNSYLVKPSGDGPYPAILFLHDRFGLTTNIRALADTLALRGYVVLCVDMFRGDRTSDIAQARTFLELVNDDNALASIGSCWRWLLADSIASNFRIGVMGIGYGGKMALRALATESTLRAGVLWYPTDLPADTLLTRIAAPLLILYASPTVDKPSAQAEMMSQRLMQQGVRSESLIIKGDDGFASPFNGAAYSAAATNDAFRTSLSFLDRRLKL